MANKILYVFTDGACKNNGKKNASAGYGVHFPNKELDDRYGSFCYTPITNQRAELYAIYKTIKYLIKTKAVEKYELIEINTDSQYSINCVTLWVKKWEKNDWKVADGSKVKNVDLIKPIRNHLKKYLNIKFIHVKAHTGKDDFASVANAVADELANQGEKEPCAKK